MLNEHNILASLFNKRQRNKDKMTAMRKRTGLTLTVGWEDSEFFPESFSLKLLLAGDTFNSFLLDRISKLFFFLSMFSLNPN